MRNIVIIGGGLAGLISSIQLIRAGISCTVIEKKSYPLHRVCGEYISNEALKFLKSARLYPEGIDIPKINFLEILNTNQQYTIYGKNYVPKITGKRYLQKDTKNCMVTKIHENYMKTT